MIKVAPSILSADFGNLKKEIQLIDRGECDYIHCDIMDGHFVKNISFGPDIIKKIRAFTKKILDVHLMISPVNKYIEKFAKAGADIITFHIEAEKDPIKTINIIKKHNIKVGIAVKPKTSINLILKLIHSVDLILIMTVEPGFGGQKFIESQLKKIKKLKKYVTDNSLTIDIEVDGGINHLTAKKCVEAGANILVAGSYIFNEQKLDYSKKIKSLKFK